MIARAGLARAGLVVLGLASAGMAQAACREDSVTLRGEFGKARFRVDVADDAAERSRGLMFVKEMPASTGMLFVYPKAQPASFWMRNTLIPLDMLFMDATGTVTRIHENAVPLDETPIPGGDEVLAVLEINGGMAAAMGIEAGAQLRHPALPQDTAAWPCAE